MNTTISPGQEPQDTDLDPLAVAMENIGEAVTVVTPDSRIRYANAACERIFGYSEAELIGEPATILVPQGEAVLDDETILASPGERWEGEVVRVRKGGVSFFAHLTLTLMRNQAQEVTGHLAVHRDVTLHKQTEETTRRLAEENSVLAEICRIANSPLDIHDVYSRFAEQARKLIAFDRIDITIADLEIAALTRAYHMGMDVPGHTRGDVTPLAGTVGEEVIRARLGLLVQPEDRRQLASLFPGAVSDWDAGRRSSLAVPLVSTRQLIGVLHLQSTRPRAYTHADLALAERIAAQIADAIANAQLYAECRRADEALRKSESNNRAFRNAIPDLMFRISRDGTFLDYVVPERDLALQPSSWLGKNITDLMPAEHAERVKYHMERALEANEIQIFEYKLPEPLAGGDLRDYEARIVASGDGEVMAIVRNITERKHLEEQLLQSQRMDAIGRLAGGMAHDFNNLLTPIMSYADLAAAALPPESHLRGFLQEIQKAGERASHLTRQLLAFSRRQTIDPKVINFNDLILNMDKMLRRLISEDIELVTLPAEDLGLVRADPGQCEQVLVNPVVNARDAMPDGGKLIIESANVKVHDNLSGWPIDIAPGEYVMVAVADNGIGMTREVKDRIFEPFFTTKRPGQGTGLGLSTSYRIVTQSEGHMVVESEPGQGTTVGVYYPRADDVLGSMSLRDESGRLPMGSETVLLVEDQPMVKEVASRVLCEQGYTVVEATNGHEALGVARRHEGKEIHLLLTDIVMPLMGGRELAEQLKATHPETKILYISGYMDDAIVHHGVLEPGAQFLQKPFTRATLAHRLRQVLET